MKTHYLTNAVLLIVVALLYWFSQQLGIEQQPAARIIATTNPNNIIKISIIRHGLTKLTFNKKNQKWYLSEPQQALANPKRIKLLLSLLTATSHAQHTKPNAALLTQLGFNEHSTRIEFDDLTIKFGGIEPISQRRYILFKQQVHLIDDTVSPIIKANFASFISGKLVTQGNIAKITMPLLLTDGSFSQQMITIEQRDGTWNSSPSKYAHYSLATLVNQWQQASALQVIPTAEPTKDHIIATIKIWLENDTAPMSIIVSNQQAMLSFYQQATGLSYQLPKNKLNTLFVKTMD